MLQKQTNISQDPSLSSTQRISALSKQTIESPPPPFPSAENNNDEKRNKNEATEKSDTQIDDQKELIKLDSKLIDTGFSELFDTFFVLRHKHLFLLRSEIRNEQAFRYHSLPALTNIYRAYELRDRCYHIQMILFEIPLGNKLNLLI